MLAAASVVVIVAGMHAAESIIVPFLLSIFLAVLWSSPLFWLQKKGVPMPIAMLFVVVAVIAIGLVLVAFIGSTLEDLSIAIPIYQDNLDQEITLMLVWLESIGISIPDQALVGIIDQAKITQLLTAVLTGLGGLLTNALLVLLMVLFMLFEASGIPTKLRVALGDADATITQLSKIVDSIKRYLAIKTMISLATGILIAVWLAIIGVDYPLLWGLLAFLLNYIPNIGSFIASIPALLVAFIQLGVGTAMLALTGYILVNGVIGNVIEPRVMGKGVGLSTLVVFLSLVFWGWVLGSVGMLLSVPLTMCIKIALESSEDTRWMAILMGSEASAESV
ncbi:MAG: AI-2E family transporter [Methanosarcinaceae archaeon]|nr:AI-2E family transporter [Methanosarcinaceae archaeon]